jgi:hypothetical protein
MPFLQNDASRTLSGYLPGFFGQARYSLEIHCPLSQFSVLHGLDLPDKDRQRACQARRIPA